jgi:hypothetical protein
MMRVAKPVIPDQPPLISVVRQAHHPERRPRGMKETFHLILSVSRLACTGELARGDSYKIDCRNKTEPD